MLRFMSAGESHGECMVAIVEGLPAGISIDMDIINNDFENLPESVRKDYTIRKQILWESEDCSESELSQKEVEFIRKHKSKDPGIGYNRWPKLNNENNT